MPVEMDIYPNIEQPVTIPDKLERKCIMRQQVESVLSKIKPALQADGGDVELVDVAGGIVKVKLTGHCAGCPMSQLTLKQGIERILKQEIPGVKEVVGV